MKNIGKYRPIFIIVAAGLFVMVIVFAGLALFYPQEAAQEAVVRKSDSTDAATGLLFDPYLYLDDDIESIREEVTNNIALPTEAPTEESEVAATEEKQEGSPSRRTTDPQTESVTLHSQRNGTKKIILPSLTKTPPSRAATVPSLSAAPSPSLPNTLYWIQLFSSSGYERTEAAQMQLAQYQIEGLITEHTIDGVRYYRLRVGPYHNQNEAKKFLSWFNQSAVFGNSYVVQVSGMATNPR